MIQLSTQIQNDLSANQYSVHYALIIEFNDTTKIRLSTVQKELSGHVYHDVNLKIQPLRDAISIKDNRYQVSKLTATMSNLPTGFSDERITDNIDWSADKDIYHCKAELYVWTQSCTNLSHCSKVFSGIIVDSVLRKDDVKFIIEDNFTQLSERNQIPKGKLPSGFEINSDYKNVVIPMVFGTVNDSPLVMKKDEQTQTIMQFLPDDIGRVFGDDDYIKVNSINNFKVKVGTMTAEVPQTSSWRTDLTWGVQEGQEAPPVNEYFADWSLDLFNNKMQWEVADNGQSIEIEKKYQIVYGQGESELYHNPLNLPAHDKLQIKIIKNPSSFETPAMLEDLSNEYPTVGVLDFTGDRYKLQQIGPDSFIYPEPYGDAEYSGRYSNMRFRGLWSTERTSSSITIGGVQTTSGTHKFLEVLENGSNVAPQFIGLPSGGGSLGSSYNDNYPYSQDGTISYEFSKFNDWMSNIIYWILWHYWNTDTNENTQLQGTYYISGEGELAQINGTYIRRPYPGDEWLRTHAKWVADNKKYELIWKARRPSRDDLIKWGSCSDAIIDDLNSKYDYYNYWANEPTYGSFNDGSAYPNNTHENWAYLDGIVIPTDIGSTKVLEDNYQGSQQQVGNMSDILTDELGRLIPNGMDAGYGEVDGIHRRYFSTTLKESANGNQDELYPIGDGDSPDGYEQPLYRCSTTNYGAGNWWKWVIGLNDDQGNYDSTYGMVRNNTMLPIITRNEGYEETTVHDEHPEFSDFENQGYLYTKNQTADVWVTKGKNTSCLEGSENDPSTFSDETIWSDMYTLPDDAIEADRIANPHSDTSGNVLPLCPLVYTMGTWLPLKYYPGPNYTNHDYNLQYSTGPHDDRFMESMKFVVEACQPGTGMLYRYWAFVHGFEWPNPTPLHEYLEGGALHPGYVGIGQGEFYDNSYDVPDDPCLYAIPRSACEMYLHYKGVPEYTTYDTAQFYVLDDGGNRSRSVGRCIFSFDSIDTSNIIANSTHSYVEVRSSSDYEHNHVEGNGIPFKMITFLVDDDLGDVNSLAEIPASTTDTTGTLLSGQNADLNTHPDDSNFISHLDVNHTNPNQKNDIVIDFAYSPITTNDAADMTMSTWFETVRVVQYSLLEKLAENQFYGDVTGRLDTGDGRYTSSGNSLITKPSDIIANVLETEVGFPVDIGNSVTTARSNHNSLNYQFSLIQEVEIKAFINEFAQSTKLIPRYSQVTNKLEFINLLPIYTSDSAKLIDAQEVIKYAYKRTRVNDIILKCRVLYNYSHVTTNYESATDEPEQGIVPNNLQDYLDYYNISDVEQHYFELKSKYIRDKDTAEQIRNAIVEENKHLHLQLDITLPIKYFNLEVGDLIYFDEIIGRHSQYDSASTPREPIKPYGIDYTRENTVLGQTFTPVFMIEKIVKDLETVKLIARQMHNHSSALISDTEIVIDIPEDESEIETEMIMLGDINMDGSVDILDIVTIIQSIINGNPLPEVEYIP